MLEEEQNAGKPTSSKPNKTSDNNLKIEKFTGSQNFSTFQGQIPQLEISSANVFKLNLTKILLCSKSL